MEKQVKLFLEFLQNDKKASDNTLQSYRRDIVYYSKYLESNNLNYGYTKMEVSEKLKLAIRETKELTIKNEKQVGDINITKVDSDNNSIKLEGVEYVVKSSYQNMDRFPLLHY